MLTIRSIINYSKPKVKAPSKARLPRGAFKSMSKAEQLEYSRNENKKRRDAAVAEGKCGTCAVRYPGPGLKTCDVCLGK